MNCIIILLKCNKIGSKGKLLSIHLLVLGRLGTYFSTPYSCRSSSPFRAKRAPAPGPRGPPGSFSPSCPWCVCQTPHRGPDTTGPVRRRRGRTAARPPTATGTRYTRHSPGQPPSSFEETYLFLTATQTPVLDSRSVSRRPDEVLEGLFSRVM